MLNQTQDKTPNQGHGQHRLKYSTSLDTMAMDDLEMLKWWRSRIQRFQKSWQWRYLSYNSHKSITYWHWHWLEWKKDGTYEEVIRSNTETNRNHPSKVLIIIKCITSFKTGWITLNVVIYDLKSQRHQILFLETSNTESQPVWERWEHQMDKLKVCLQWFYSSDSERCCASFRSITSSEDRGGGPCVECGHIWATCFETQLHKHETPALVYHQKNAPWQRH